MRLIVMGMSDSKRADHDAAVAVLRNDSHHLLVGGATLGTFAAVTGALFGATCPMCIVVAPVMLGAGAYKRWRLVCAERDRISEPKAE